MDLLYDNHTHFTGALPIEFIWDRLNRNIDRISNNDFVWDKLISSIDLEGFINLPIENRVAFKNEFDNNLRYFFSEDYRSNLSNFFKLYSFIQSFTKEYEYLKFWDLYKEGAYAITNKFIKDDISQFQIIAGANINKEKTICRIKAMSKGISIAEKENKAKKKRGFIRITFIRDNNKIIKNFSEESLYAIFKILESKTILSERIKGFDFSGEENPNDLGTVKEIVEEIQSFNKYRKRRNKKTFNISIHAGENFLEFDNHTILEYFYNILDLNIDTICHGTFLWIPSDRIQISTNDNYHRLKLLKKLGKKKVELEICPTANKYLTPIKFYSDINTRLLKKNNILYTINTDNSTIFSTNIKNEYEKISNG